MSLLAHLLLDEFVRLVDTLPQSTGHATTSVLESGTGTSIREISHLFLLDVLCGSACKHLQKGRISTIHLPGTVASANVCMVLPANSTKGSLPWASAV